MHARDSLRALAVHQDGVITTTDLRAAEITPDQARWMVRRHELERLHPGICLFEPDTYVDVPFRARARAALIYHQPDAVLVLSSAAQLLGIEGLRPEPTVVHVAVPTAQERHQRRAAGVELHVWKLAPGDVTELNGLRCTVPPRTATDLVLRNDRNHAVAILDSAPPAGGGEPRDPPCTGTSRTVEPNPRWRLGYGCAVWTAASHRRHCSGPSTTDSATYSDTATLDGPAGAWLPKPMARMSTADPAPCYMTAIGRTIS